MRLGRNFSNLLLLDNLSAPDRKAFAAGRLTLMEAERRALASARADLVGQIEKARALKLEHVDLAAWSPSPFEAVADHVLFSARETAKILGLTFSLFLGSDKYGPERENRRVIQRHIDVAKRLGAVNVSFGVNEFMPAPAIRGLVGYAMEQGVLVHLENDALKGPPHLKQIFDAFVWLCERGLPLGLTLHLGGDLACNRRELHRLFENLPARPRSLHVRLTRTVLEAHRRALPLHYGGYWFEEDSLGDAFRLFRQTGVSVVIFEFSCATAREMAAAGDLLERDHFLIRASLPWGRGG